MTPPALVAWLVTGWPSLGWAAAGLAAVSASFEIAYLFLLSTAYRRGELSVVYPIARGSAPMLSVLVGIGILGERLATVQLVGVALLIAGILAVTLPQTSGRATVPALLTGVAIPTSSPVAPRGVSPPAPRPSPCLSSV